MLKKFFASFVMAAIFLISSTAWAGYEETIPEGVDLSTVKTLAVALPQHYKIEATEPTMDEFADILSNAARVSKLNVVSYDDMIENIWRDAKVDIKALHDENSKKIYAENVSKYADAYVTATSANNNKFVQFFFEVRDAKTGDLLYMLSTQSRYFSKDLKGYSKACDEFYKTFDSAVQKAEKKSKKK